MTTDPTHLDAVLYHATPYNTDVAGGAKQYATDWLVGNAKYRVSSVNSEFVCETMVFRFVNTTDDDPSYFDLWADHTFRSTEPEHRNFLASFLENMGS